MNDNSLLNLFKSILDDDHGVSADTFASMLMYLNTIPEEETEVVRQLFDKLEWQDDRIFLPAE